LIRRPTISGCDRGYFREKESGMSEFVIFLLVAAGVISMGWWLGAGPDPLDQLIIAWQYI
jgi:hypothetical protein